MAEDWADDPAAGLEKGISEFNEADFYEAHDTWEETWRGVRGSERLFFQGMIQLAIGYYHLMCENYPGAEHLLIRGIEKLEGFLPGHRKVDLADLIVQAANTLEAVKTIRAGKQDASSAGRFPKIKRIEKSDRVPD